MEFTPPILYWTLVAVLLTVFAKWEITRHYEKPVLKLREATEKVANGDFSVYAGLSVPSSLSLALPAR